MEPGVVTGDESERQIVPCGSAGSFVFVRPGGQYDGVCRPVAAGSEVPSAIPVEPAPRLPAAFPCAGGSCLGHDATDRPWVAILDWPTAHGWSVAATVLEASDRRVDVQLYDLTAPGMLAAWVPGVSDLHVLVQLCALAETAKKPGDRPLAVNMSFGRLAAATACDKQPPSLPCLIGDVLSRLAAEDGVAAVAAAGNHHEMLFPASLPGVVSAGALDLSWLGESRKVRASTQTPPAADALMLGYGLYLSLATGTEGGAEWPAPPGSSYAAALFTGWLSGARAGGSLLAGPLPKEARWAPVSTAQGLALAMNGAPLPGSELQGPRTLLERALAATPAPHDPWPGATLELEGPAPSYELLSLLHAQAGNGPQPGVDPCVPCRGNGLEGGAPEGAGSVVVDLSSSGGLPPSMILLAVFLRVGTEVYRFDGSRDPLLLAALSSGSLGELALTGVEGVFKAGQQPSLVLIVGAGGGAYWHEVPLYLTP